MSTSDTTAESIRPGMLFCDRYRIERRLDDGGMATIYLATDETQQRPVAIKVLFDRYSGNEVVRARFLDEGRIQAMLDHPNIVHVHQVVTEPVLSFVMEYVDGDTLEDYLQQHDPIDEVEIVDLMMPVMSAIGFAHNKGIVHRDLKPSNILLDESGGYLEPKVMDFGVAKISRGKELTVDGTTVGTLHYMSPEQIVGASDIDGRADIYSMGCSLYKLCTGEVPFNASSEFALMMAHVEADPTPPAELRGDLSRHMDEIILRALEKKPEHRFQTIKEMTAALMQLGGDEDDDDGGSTITRPIPGHLLEFAMEADEVAPDKTQEMRLEHLVDAGEDDGRDDVDTVDTEVSSKTHELSKDALLQKIQRDRDKARKRHTKDTRSLSQVETVEREEPDSKEPTKRPSNAADTAEKELDQLTTRPSTRTAPDETAPTTEKMQPVFQEDDDPQSAKAPKTAPMPEITAQRLADESSDIDRDSTDRMVDEVNSEVDKTQTFEREEPSGEQPPVVDSQEVTEVMSRENLTSSGDGHTPTESSSDPDRDIDAPRSNQRARDKSTIRERKIQTRKSPSVGAGDTDDESTSSELPTAQRGVSNRHSDRRESGENRSAAPSPDDSDREQHTSEEIPSVKKATQTRGNAQSRRRTPAPRSEQGADGDRSASSSTARPRRERSESSKKHRDSRRVRQYQTVEPDDEMAGADDEEASRRVGDGEDRGDPMARFRRDGRQETQNEQVETRSTKGMVFLAIGVVALIASVGVLTVVLVFL